MKLKHVGMIVVSVLAIYFLYGDSVTFIALCLP